MSRRRTSTAFSLFAFQDIITSVTGIMVLLTLILALELVTRIETAPPRKTGELISEMRAALTANEASVQALTQELDQQAERLEEELAYNANTLRDSIRKLETRNGELANDLDRLGKERQNTESRRKKIEAKRGKQNQQEIEQQIAAVRRELEELKRKNRTFFNPAKGDSKAAWLVELSKNRAVVALAGKPGAPRVFQSPAAFLTWAKGRNSNADYFVLLLKPSGITAFTAIRQSLEKDQFDIGFDLLEENQTAIDRKQERQRNEHP